MMDPPPTLKREFLYDFFFCKIKRLPKEVGGGPHTFLVCHGIYMMEIY